MIKIIKNMKFKKKNVFQTRFKKDLNKFKYCKPYDHK